MNNDTLIRALLRQPTEYTPIWLMRQAGRYLAEYQQTRAKAGSFMALARSPALATEVTLQPLERFPLDAAILFSDILTVPDAMGLGLDFVEGEGPKFERPVRTENDVRRLAVPDPELSLGYVMDAVREIRRSLDGRVPLIGFSGSPWTLACYMVEGGGSRDFRYIKTMLYDRPDLLEQMLNVNTQAVTAYLNAQIAAGAQAVMIFDTWGGILAEGLYQRYSLANLRQIVAGLTRAVEGQRVPVVVYSKGAGQWLGPLASIGADALGLDWTVHLGVARELVKDRCALQGNIDPMVLFASEQAVRSEARRVLDMFGNPQRDDGQLGGHVFNLGHGIAQHTPPEAVAALVDEVHRYSRTLRHGRAPA